ncbi:STY0301 family protein [Massilia sp. S19_KUP03_FR1]|uniref:STY0301 family protein n=1 Tax=Massilia sp. S19_KUP03_FR1 TaxID=3025503 RepID=UPI002FCD895E
MKFISLLLLAAPLHAVEIRCPERWAPEGWGAQGSAPGGRVRDAGVIVGPLENRGDLRGAEKKTEAGYEVRFAGLNDYAEPLTKWAYCSYGLNARLLRKLPDATTECVAKVRRASAAVACK